MKQDYCLITIIVSILSFLLLFFLNTNILLSFSYQLQMCCVFPFISL